MAQDVKIALPKLGESIVSATVVQWFKKVGDTIREDEPLLEVTTDKVNSEIPSTVTGVVKQILVKVDEEVEVGTALAIIQTTAAGSSVSEPKDIPAHTSSHKTQVEDSGMQTTLSPAILRLAGEHHLSIDEMMKIKGSGGGGRISKKDVEEYLAKKSFKGKCPFADQAPIQTHGTLDIEKVKMTGMRKAIAENMVKSFYEAPHASLITEVDVTEIIKTINKHKESFLKEHGIKLTITTFIAKAIAEAVKEYPLINTSLDGDTIVIKRFVNLGIAVSVDQGIMVPVIKNCHIRSIVDMAKAIGELSSKARNGKLQPDDIRDGTITMTNFGMSGTLIGIPIIRYPEVAIIGIGAITKRVVVLDDDSFGVRSLMYISLTFDHRVLDGMYGCGFLESLKKHLESSSISF